MLVFTSALNLHERALSVNNTWLKDFPCGYLIGGNFIDPKLRMISAGPDVGEDYYSAADKQYYGLKKAFELHPDKSWYFITGCDAFIYSENLVEILSKYDPHKDHFVGGYPRKFKMLNEEIIVISGGAGFALSHSLAEKIVEAIPDIYSLKDKLSQWEWSACDQVLAYYIECVLKVEPSICDGFSHYPPYSMREEFHCAPIAYHMLNIREMYTLYAGKIISKPNAVFWCFDKFHKVLIKIFKTKSLVNKICNLFYGRR